MTRIVKLRDTCPRLRPQHSAPRRRKIIELADVLYARAFHSVEREITVVDRLRLATGVLFNITATNDPVALQLRQSVAYVAIKMWIAPRSTRVVNTNRRIRDHRAVEIACLALRNLAKRNAHTRQF